MNKNEPTSLSIILVVTVGALLTVGIIFLGRHFPYVLISGLFFIAAGLLFASAYKGLRAGVIEVNVKTGTSAYSRNRNPFGFWFYILFCMFLACISLCTAVYFLSLIGSSHLKPLKQIENKPQQTNSESTNR